MSCISRNVLLVVLAGVVFSFGSVLFGAELRDEPGINAVNSSTIYPAGGPIEDGPGLNGNRAIRDLRTDFVRKWHIFADTENDGILNPGDTRIGTFKNWWTPVSAATQHGYEIGAPPAAGPEYPSTPIDHQANWTTNPVQGLPQPQLPAEDAGRIGFYMTYSHFDNSDFDREFYNDGPVGGGTGHDILYQRNHERNGYAMGWLTSVTDTDRDGNVRYWDDTTGKVKMDIFIHNGKNRDGEEHDFGSNTSTLPVVYDGEVTVRETGNGVLSEYSKITRSDPQVVQSNEMSILARQDDNLMLVADYRDELVITDKTSKTGYDYGAKTVGYVYDGFNEDKYLVDGDLDAGTASTHATPGQFTEVIESMDVREVNSYDTPTVAALGGIMVV